MPRAEKRCSRCGQTKKAGKENFSKDRGSADGFYSQCKECERAVRQGAPSKLV